MRDIDDEVRDLLNRTARTRYQFLQVELQTCFTALDFAKHELSVGNRHIVEMEIGVIERGIHTIRRFLGETSAEQRRTIEQRMQTLQTDLDPLKAKVAG